MSQEETAVAEKAISVIFVTWPGAHWFIASVRLSRTVESLLDLWLIGAERLVSGSHIGIDCNGDPPLDSPVL